MLAAVSHALFAGVAGRVGGQRGKGRLSLGDLASGRSVLISLVEMPSNFAACALCVSVRRVGRRRPLPGCRLQLVYVIAAAMRGALLGVCGPGSACVRD